MEIQFFTISIGGSIERHVKIVNQISFDPFHTWGCIMPLLFNVPYTFDC